MFCSVIVSSLSPALLGNAIQAEGHVRGTLSFDHGRAGPFVCDELPTSRRGCPTLRNRCHCLHLSLSRGSLRWLGIHGRILLMNRTRKDFVQKWKATKLVAPGCFTCVQLFVKAPRVPGVQM